MRSGVWSELTARSVTINTFRRNLQRAYLDIFDANLNGEDVPHTDMKPLIRGELLQQGRLGLVNLHGGLSPEYRGADCTFWALYNSEPGKIGCTLHFIDQGIDTGRLIAHICPEVHDGDDELILFWRSVRESARVYAELMQRMASGEMPGEPQSGKGRLYQVKQRGLLHERKVARMLRNGLLHDTGLGTRVRWFGVD